MKKISPLLCMIGIASCLLFSCSNSSEETSSSDKSTILTTSSYSSSSSSSQSSSSSSTPTPTKETSKLLVISDVHVIDSDDTTKNYLKNTLTYAKNNNVDVILFNGDSISYATDEVYSIIDGVFEDVFGSVSVDNRPEFLFNMGNHEFYKDSSCRHQDTDWDREFGKFKTFANKWMKQDISSNVYSRNIKGVNYVVAFPGPGAKDGYYYLAALGQYSDNDLASLKTALDEASKNGNPIVLGTHNPWGYTYGEKGYRVVSEPLFSKMRTLLANYPNIINFTSHTHFSNLHDRDIDQTSFTSINVGPHCYGKYSSEDEFDENDDLVTYANVSDHSLSNDSIAQAQYGKTSFGIILDFGLDNMLVNRINLTKGQYYSHGSFTIPYGINKDNMHDKFYYEKGERKSDDLVFDKDDTLSLSAETGKTSCDLNLKFKDVNKPWAVEGYKIVIKGSDKQVVKTTWWQSMFWAALETKTSYDFTISNLKLDSEYEVSVYPLDFYHHYHTPIVNIVKTGSEKTDADELEIASGDLFYVSSIYQSSFSGGVYTLDKKCTETADVLSGYSHKLSCTEEGDGWPSVTYELPNSYDLTKYLLNMDVKFYVAHKWIGIRMYDSNNEYVCGQIDYDFASSDWSHLEVSSSKMKEKIQEGKNLSDIKYIKFFVNFDDYKGQKQAVYFDNLLMKENTTPIDFVTYTSSTTINFSEEITSWTTSSKHLRFKTNTTTQFMFTITNGDRLSAKMYLTIGDGKSPTLSGVASGGYVITSNTGYYQIDIVFSKIEVNTSYEQAASKSAKSINFREGFPINIADIEVVD